ncbi:50S ribosomal protein L10 [Candidatus Palauibacter sp.]|uniref:50S ribosomal protein L10 n=1 Tax=Candidatus Palauibacter sp. TaxID=3101350 RepID=UPI003B5161AB
MRLEEKQRITRELSQQLEENGTIYLTDFTGLNVKAVTELRARLREQGLTYRVVKNTLMKRALEDVDLPDLRSHLEGPTGLVFSESDPVVPARILKEFAKAHEDRPVVKIGVIDRVEATPEDVGRMADIPPREVLLGGIAGGLTASVGGIAGALGALIRDIADMIEQVAKKNQAA